MIFEYNGEEFKVICNGIYRPPSDVQLGFLSYTGNIYSRVSMGLTDRRKTAKNLADSRKNGKILTVSRK